MDLFACYHWPGNVRELQNVIRFLLVRCHEPVVRPHHLPAHLPQECRTMPPPASPRRRRGKLDPERVRAALEVTGGNRLQAARQLGVSRATLYRFLTDHPLS
jgi:transcriptional regulator of acetoin/glycerol metabolism